MLRTTWRLCAVTLGLLTVASCSMPAQRPLAEPVAPTVLRLDDETPQLTEGADYRAVGSVAGVLNGRVAHFAGTADDGAEIYVRDSASADGDHEDDDPHALALIARDPKSAETRVLSDRPRTQGPVDAERIPGNALQFGEVAVSGRYVAWVESVSVAPTGDLYAYDLKSDSERLLARGQEPKETDDPWPSAYAAPLVVGDRVYFVGYTSLARGDLPGESSVFVMPLDGSEPPVEIAPGATAVFSDVGGRLQVIVGEGLVTWNPVRGRDGQLGDSLRGAIYANQGVRVSVPAGGSTIEIDSPEHGSLTVELGEERAVYFSGTRRWVAFDVESRGCSWSICSAVGWCECRRSPCRPPPRRPARTSRWSSGVVDRPNPGSTRWCG